VGERRERGRCGGGRRELSVVDDVVGVVNGIGFLRRVSREEGEGKEE
jgi:hypothetical protein